MLPSACSAPIDSQGQLPAIAANYDEFFGGHAACTSSDIIPVGRSNSIKLDGINGSAGLDNLDHHASLVRPPSIDDFAVGRESHHGGSVATLRIVVRGAQNLPKDDALGTCDPYAVVSIGPQKRQTKVVADSHEPQWEEELEYRLSLPVGDQSLKVDVVSFDRYAEHDYIGTAILPLSSVWDIVSTAAGAAVDQGLPLRNMRDPAVPDVRGPDQLPAMVTLTIALASHHSNHEAPESSAGVAQHVATAESGTGHAAQGSLPGFGEATTAAAHDTDGRIEAQEGGTHPIGQESFGFSADLGEGSAGGAGFGDAGFGDGASGFGGAGFGGGFGTDAGFGAGFGEAGAAASGDGFGAGGFGESGFGHAAGAGFGSDGFGDAEVSLHNPAGAGGAEVEGAHAGTAESTDTAAAGRAAAEHEGHSNRSGDGSEAAEHAPRGSEKAGPGRADSESGEGDKSGKAAARDEDDDWGAGDDGAGRAKLTIRIKSKDEIEADAKVRHSDGLDC